MKLRTDSHIQMYIPIIEFDLSYSMLNWETLVLPGSTFGKLFSVSSSRSSVLRLPIHSP